VVVPAPVQLVVPVLLVLVPVLLVVPAGVMAGLRVG
jgi:hypothetical protein